MDPTDDRLAQKTEQQGKCLLGRAPFPLPRLPLPSSPLPRERSRGHP